MRALCVDDERIPLMTLKKAVEGSKNISNVVAFDDEEEALSWAKTNPLDVAFLDIELHAMNGLELAEKLIEYHPQISIVFCTSYEQYAVRALRMHIDAGYLIKPFRPSQVQEEIDHIAAKRGSGRKLKANCFGNFEAFIGDHPLEFNRKRTKELLAYLIDRRGASVTAAEFVTILWEDEDTGEKKKDLLYHLVSDLKQTLEGAGQDDVFISQQGGYSVNTGRIDCDYYRLLDGDVYARRFYRGEYMSQYSWAEYTNSWIADEIKLTE